MSRARVISFSIAAVIGVGGVCWQLATQRPSRDASASPKRHATSAKPAKQPILTPPVAQLLSTETIPLADRLNTLATIGTTLPEADRTALLASITNTPPNGLTAPEWHSLANDILQALRHQQPFTESYTDHLIALWHDKQLDPTLRDYAIQQLRAWVIDADTRTAHEERSEKLDLIKRTFLDSVTPGHPDCDPQSTTTGTILMALDELAHPPVDAPSSSPSPSPSSFKIQNSKFSIKNLPSLLLSHAASQESHRGVRSTALQLCSHRGITEALPIARNILNDSSSEAILRMSAISLIGTLGTAGDLGLLASLQQQKNQDPLLQTSLQKAISELTQRTN